MMDTNYAGQGLGRVATAMENRVMSRFDRDGSGGISIAEAGDRGRLARNFTRFDLNDDGVLSQGEVSEAVAERLDRSVGMMSSERMNAMAAWMQMQEANEQRVAAFDQLDTDADGAISDAELTAQIDAMRAAEEAARLREEKINEINRMDLDGDGRLSAEELQAELDLRAENRAVAAYDGLDADGDGSLSDAELMAGAVAATPMPADTASADAAPMPVTEPEAMAPEMTASEEMAPEMTAPEAEMAPEMTATDADMAPTEVSAEAEDTTTLSLIENVFEDLLEARGETLGMDRLASMSRELYAEAQDILLDQLELAAESVGEPDNQDDDQVAYT